MASQEDMEFDRVDQRIFKAFTVFLLDIFAIPYGSRVGQLTCNCFDFNPTLTSNDH